MAEDQDRDEQIELIRRFRAGDEEAFRTLLVRHGGALSARIRRNLPAKVARRVAVSDVLQESCAVAFRRREHLEVRGADAFRNWLLGIVDNKVREAVRSHAQVAARSAHREVSRHDRLDTGLFVGRQGTPSRHAIQREEGELTREAMSRLPDPYRRVLKLTLLQGMTMREAAERMGRSREAVKKLYGRAVVRLKTVYEEVRRESGS